MNQSNRYYIGLIVLIAAFLTLISPDLSNNIHNVMNNFFPPEQASKYGDFISLLASVGIMYFLINWFSKTI